MLQPPTARRPREPTTRQPAGGPPVLRLLADPVALRVIAAAVLVMALAGAAVQFGSAGPRGTATGPHLGADFAQFYAAGWIQAHEGRERLYDLAHQDAVAHRLVPGLPPGQSLPFVYPPFLAPLFVPLARMPYAAAFAVWLAISATLAATAVGLMLTVAPRALGRDRWTAALMVASFEPLALECWLGGQIASLGAVIVAATLALGFRRNRPFAAGLALAGLLYKPTLLVLLLPLAVAGRRGRLLAGFATGAAVLAAVSVGVVGIEGVVGYARLLVGYGRIGAGGGAAFRTAKYVDLASALRLLGLAPPPSRAIALLIGLALGGWLVRTAWRVGPRAGPTADLTWAAALCWTPVLGPYGPVYDLTLALPGLLLASDALAVAPDRDRFTAGVRTLYLAALVAPALVVSIGIQVATPAALALGGILLGTASRRLPSLDAASPPNRGTDDSTR